MGHLRLEQVGKSFREYKHPLHRLLEWMGWPPRHTEKWVLKNINFKIEPGESVGLIGRNGAGKSTLLKIITGVTSPSTGKVSCGGSLSALLELGMGFHPEFTGRQNVLMQAYLQGMSHAQIVEQMDAIAEFAELGDYFDKPVRIYSSGMQVRLAFSVATAVRPDILIVDEALAVGDAYFQHKCFDRIRKYRRDGTTLLFVSHDPGAVKSLCDRAILIEGGAVMKDGLPADVLDFYNAIIVPGISQEAMQNLLTSKQAVRSGDGQMRILQAQWRVNGSETLALVAGTPAELNLVIEVHQPVDDYTIGLLIKDRVGNDIFGTNTFHMAHAMPKLEAGKRYTVNFRFPSINLGPSYYSLTLALHASNNHLAGNYDWWERAIAFQVVPAEKTSTIGVCHMAVHMDSINEAR